MRHRGSAWTALSATAPLRSRVPRARLSEQKETHDICYQAAAVTTWSFISSLTG